MSRERELLKRALDRLHLDNPNPPPYVADLCKEIKAELAKPEPEPVAWIEVGHPFDGPYDCHYMEILPKGRHHVYTEQPDQSARIAELEAELAQAYKTVDENWVRHQQLAALQDKREPLSNEKIELLRVKTLHESEGPLHLNFHERFARAIETAHGIGE